MTNTRRRNQNNGNTKPIDALIRQGIRSGRFVAGQRLVEIDLINQFGATQRQVRDALRRLEAEGIVAIEKNRGATVRKISRKEVECILDVLDSLSLLAVRKATEKIEEPSVRKQIKSSLTAAKKFRKLASTEKQIQKYLDENVRFWDSIALIVDNPILWEIRERLETLLFRLQMQGFSINSDPNKWIHYHEEILEAILKQDYEEARQLVMTASDDIREVILELSDDIFT